MKASEYISELQKIIDEHGDLELHKYSGGWGRIPCAAPVVSYKKILKGRETKPDFYQTFSSPEERKGEKVIKV